MRKTGGDKWLSLLNTETRSTGSSPILDGVSLKPLFVYTDMLVGFDEVYTCIIVMF